MTELNKLQIEIGNCQWNIDKAIETRDVDRYNEYYARLTKLTFERKELLKLTVIGG